MPIDCTFGDSAARLRETQGNPGPLSKMSNAEYKSVVDKFRVVKFVKAMAQEIEEYESVLLDLGKKFGEPMTVVYQIPPEKQAEYDAELLKLNQRLGNPVEAQKGSYRILPQNQEAFNAEVRKLNAEPRHIQAANPLPPSVCDVLTPKDLILLGSLVVEPADPSSDAPASK